MGDWLLESFTSGEGGNEDDDDDDDDNKLCIYSVFKNRIHKVLTDKTLQLIS